MSPVRTWHESDPATFAHRVDGRDKPDAMAVVSGAVRRGKTTDPWLARMLARKPRKLVAVALANRMARIAWALMTNNEVYRAPAAA